MHNDIFRKKSIDKMTSPEQLDDYLRVTGPGVWLILGAVILLLGGICVWGIFGRLDTVISTAGIAADGMLTCYVDEDTYEQLEVGMSVTVDGTAYSISAIADAPGRIDDTAPELLLYLADLALGDWVRPIAVEADLPDGVYAAEIVCDSVSPLSFVLN